MNFLGWICCCWLNNHTHVKKKSSFLLLFYRKLYLNYLLIEVVTAIFMLSTWRHFRRDVFKGLKQQQHTFSASRLPVAVSKFENHLPSYVEGQRGRVTCLCLMLKLRWDNSCLFLEDNCYFHHEDKKKKKKFYCTFQ